MNEWVPGSKNDRYFRLVTDLEQTNSLYRGGAESLRKLTSFLVFLQNDGMPRDEFWKRAAGLHGGEKHRSTNACAAPSDFQRVCGPGHLQAVLRTGLEITIPRDIHCGGRRRVSDRSVQPNSNAGD